MRQDDLCSFSLEWNWTTAVNNKKRSSIYILQAEVHTKDEWNELMNINYTILPVSLFHPEQNTLSCLHSINKFQYARVFVVSTCWHLLWYWHFPRLPRLFAFKDALHMQWCIESPWKPYCVISLSKLFPFIFLAQIIFRKHSFGNFLTHESNKLLHFFHNLPPLPTCLKPLKLSSLCLWEWRRTLLSLLFS